MFLTGATGFIGGALLRRLIASNRFEHFYVLVRGDDPQERFFRLFTDLSQGEADRITVLGGDVTQVNLGLNDGQFRILEHKAVEVECFHTAADIRFGEEHRDEIFNVNLGGTRHLLDLLSDVGIARLHYISTAYVGGDRKGEVKEDELRAGQKFRNPYEESKFWAEELIHVHTKNSGPLTTIYRPSIVIGDSGTGVTGSFAGYYSYMRAFALLKREVARELGKQPEAYRQEDIYSRDGKLHLPLVIWGSPEAAINLVCIDYVVNLIERLSAMPNAGGKTFHVVNPSPPEAQQLLEDSLEALEISGVQLLDAQTMRDNLDLIKRLVVKTSIIDALEKRIHGDVKRYIDYSETGPVFSMENVGKILGEIPPHPAVGKELIEKLLQYALRVNFGRNGKRG